MFDVGAAELLVIAIVAILVIGPKDMPMALRTAGRWIARMRRVSGHFRSGLDTMIREAEMEEMDRKWRERNEAIMAEHPQADFHPDDEMQRQAAPDARLTAAEAKAAYKAEPAPTEPPSAQSDAPIAPDEKKG